MTAAISMLLIEISLNYNHPVINIRYTTTTTPFSLLLPHHTLLLLPLPFNTILLPLLKCILVVKASVLNYTTTFSIITTTHITVVNFYFFYFAVLYTNTGIGFSPLLRPFSGMCVDGLPGDTSLTGTKDGKLSCRGS